MLLGIDKPVVNEETSVSEALFCLFKVLYLHKLVTVDVLCLI